MQQAIPYKLWTPLYATGPVSRPSSLNNPMVGTNTGESIGKGTEKMMSEMVTESAVVVFVRRGCCMGHVVKHLLLGHGVNPGVYEVDETEEAGVVMQLESIGVDLEGKTLSTMTVQFPAVFIGGRLCGGLDRVIAAHISGELVPLLKEAGALWLWDWLHSSVIFLILFFLGRFGRCTLIFPENVLGKMHKYFSRCKLFIGWRIIHQIGDFSFSNLWADFTYTW